MNISAIYAGQVASARVMQHAAMRSPRAGGLKDWKARVRLAVPAALAALAAKHWRQ
jgi:hypothetical protein